MIPTPRQYRDMIDAARSGGYAYPAVNVTSSETLNAAIRGFAEARSDGIVQITTSAAEYLSGPAADVAAGARAFAEFAHVLAARSPGLIALHTDHATSGHVDDFLRPLLAMSRRRVTGGKRPLFNSHMFDGSDLALEDNLDVAASLLREGRDLGVMFEFEVGTVGGEEDGINHHDVARERLFTTQAEALRVAEVLGTGERGRYLLAATFGNVHGHYAPGNVQLRPGLLFELQDALAQRAPGARFDFVFHGGSGSTVDEIHAAVANGVVKMNVDTDMQYAFTHAVENHVLEALPRSNGTSPGGVDKRVYDPRTWGRKAEEAMAARVAAAAEVLGSAGRTLT
jgi:fructose-bisphosphate aldolase, class II